MESLIENYRGYEIRFNTDTEKFVTDTGNEGKEKPSFASAKKWIDDYIKDNSAFVPFDFIHKSYNEPKEYRAIGLRKDGAINFDKGGRVTQLSTYEEGDCYVGSLSMFKGEIEVLKKAKQEEDIKARIRKEAERVLEAKIKELPTLKEYIKQFAV